MLKCSNISIGNETENSVVVVGRFPRLLRSDSDGKRSRVGKSRDISSVYMYIDIYLISIYDRSLTLEGECGR